jgi:hypothetical protein
MAEMVGLGLLTVLLDRLGTVELVMVMAVLAQVGIQALKNPVVLLSTVMGTLGAMAETGELMTLVLALLV